MNLSPLPIQRFYNNLGLPLVGGKLFTYVAGSTTKIATYSDSSGTLNTNPVRMNFRGECSIWLDPTLTYKFVLAPANDTDPPTNPIWTVDNIAAAFSLVNLTQALLASILYPQTAREASLGIVPTNYLYQQGVPERYGAAANGVTDDSVAIRTACLTGDQDYGTVSFTAGKRYRFEATQGSPVTGLGTQAGYNFASRTGIVINVNGATLVSTSASNQVYGLFTFLDCTACRVINAYYQGVYVSDTSWTAGLAVFAGLCVACSVEGEMTGGYTLGGIYGKNLDGTDTSLTMPRECSIRGKTYSAKRGATLQYAQHGHAVDLETYDTHRSMYIGNVSGLSARVVSSTPKSNDILITCTFAGTAKDLDIEYIGLCNYNTSPIEIQSQDGTNCTFERIRITGFVRQTGVGPGLEIPTFPGADTTSIFRAIDFSDLQVETTSTGIGFDCSPANTCTLEDITFPRIIRTDSGNALSIDNTATATMRRLFVPSGFNYRVRDATGTGAGAIISNNGTVSLLCVGDGVADINTSGSAIQILNADGLSLGKIQTTNSEAISLAGSVNISPGNWSHQGNGFVYSGSLTDGQNLSGLLFVNVTSGSPTINSFARIVPGTEITFAFNGGTPTFADGANMKLAGSANFVATAEDVLTLVCIDAPSGGPLATSTMWEKSRSVN